MTARKRKYRMVLIGTLLATLASPFALSLGRLGEQEAVAADFASSDPPIRVTAGKPMRKTLVRRTEQPGQIEAFAQAPLFAKISGFIDKLSVDIGDQVKTGQVLAEISAPELLAEARQKKALLEVSRAAVEQAVAAVKVAEAAKVAADALVMEVEASNKRAEAERTRSSLELGRMNSLLGSQAITQRSVDESKSKLQAAEAALQEIEAKAKTAAAVVLQKKSAMELAQADLSAAQAKVKVAEADVERAEAMFGYAKIVAPFDGTIASRNIDIGHFVQPSAKTPSDNGLFVIVRADKVRVFIEIPELDAGLVMLGNEASLRVPSLGNLIIAGKVTRTSWVLQASTRTLKVEIDLPNTDGKLRPGMYVQGDVKIVERKDVLSLPKGAVLVKDNQYSCFCISADNMLVRVPITVGIRSGDDFEVVTGLAGNEQVVLTNAVSYREGQKVEIAAKK